MMISFNTPVMHIFSASTIVLFFMSTSQADIFAANKSKSKSIQPTVIENDNYEYLEKTGKSRISEHSPEWTDYKESDPGKTIEQMRGMINTGDIKSERKPPVDNKIPAIK